MHGKHAEKTDRQTTPPALPPPLPPKLTKIRRMSFILTAAMLVLMLVSGGKALWKWQADHTEKAFFKAVNANNLTLVRQCITHHPELVRARFPINGGTALHLAEAAGHSEQVALLLQQHNVEINARDNDGATPLYVATEAGDLPTIYQLIARGADVKRGLYAGFTPLHFAAGKDRVDVAALLLANGADVNAITPGGLTPLHIAARTGARSMVQFLLAHGADALARDQKGHTPADSARDALHDTLADELQHGKRVGK